jgi:hypothetical protein
MSFDDDDIGDRGEPRPCCGDRFEIDRDAVVAGRQVRRDRRREGKRVAVRVRHDEAVGGGECRDIGIDLRSWLDACGDRLHPGGAHVRGDQRAQQRGRDACLAHTGVGAGDENAARHRRGR